MDDTRVDVQAAWAALTTEDPPVGYFEPADVAHLPPAAWRLLTRALAPGVALTPTVVLAMEGHIRLRGWMAFQARQVLREISMHRWGAPRPAGLGLHPFGAAIDDHARHDGITIACAGSGGWHRGTQRQDDGAFIRWTVTSASFPGTTFPETTSVPPDAPEASWPVPNLRRQGNGDD